MTTAGPMVAEEGGVTPRRVARTRDLGPQLLVWGVWATMLAALLGHIARYGRNIPMSEDWLMVPPLTGRQPDFWTWVWSQNNEHRLPLPRLMYLGLLELTRDFRVGMFFNAMVLAALAAAMLLIVRRLRGGRTRYVDAFFPLVVLHLGQMENVLWSWQIQFVVSAAVIVSLLLILVAARMPLSWSPALALGALLAALPLTGASGLPFVVPLVGGVAAFVWSGPLMDRRGTASHRRAGVLLCLGAGAALVITALYFVGYERPSWTPENPGIVPTAKTTARFVAMGLGPAYNSGQFVTMGLGPTYNALSALFVAGIIGSAFVVLVHRVLHGRQDPERRRATALIGFLVGSVLLALSIGYGRAALVPRYGLPDRYALIAMPAMVAAWFAWERYGPARARVWVHGTILAALLVLLPFNIERGRQWRDYYSTGMAAVEHDLDTGVPKAELVKRDGVFLMHWDPEGLARGMHMLRAERIGPFARLNEGPLTPVTRPEPHDRTASNR
jgi:hypothetical protein